MQAIRGVQGFPRAKFKGRPVPRTSDASYGRCAMHMQPSSSEKPTFVFRLVAWISRPLVRLAFRPRVGGLEQLPRGGFVLCANHLSAFDPWALSIPLYPRQPRYLAKAELFVWPFRRLLAAGGLFPVQRGDRDSRAVRTAIDHAKAGRIVLVFPEGARRRKRILRPRRGAARIALDAGVPLVPAAVRGTDSALAFRRWRVAFGSPVPLDDLRSLPPRAAAEEATRRLWATVAALELQLESESSRPPRTSLATFPTTSDSGARP